MTDQIPSIVTEFFDAYNRVDIGTIKALISDDVRWEHKNRFQGAGLADLVESIHKFAAMVPGRAFSAPTRWAVRGDTVFLVHAWSGVPADDYPEWNWRKGERVQGEGTLSVMRLEGGKIAEWSDYGTS